MRWAPIDSLSDGSDGGAIVRDLVRDASIVVLGEELHGDGATFAAKARMAQFLFDACGFDTMGWESPIYDVRRMNHLGPEVSEDEFGACGLFSIWHGAEIDPLVRYCREREIEHAGVDCQILDVQALAVDIAGWSSILDHPISVDQAASFLSGDGDAIESTLRRLRDLLAAAGDTWPATAIANVLLNREQQRVGSSLYGPYLDAKRRGEVIELDPVDRTLIEANSIRDEAMGANAIRLVEDGRRVVLWAANYHGIRSLGSASPYADAAPGVRTMGDILHEHLGTRAKVVVGTSREGSRWDFDRWQEVPIHERAPGSVERTWPTEPSPQLGVVDPHDVLDGRMHLVGIGPMGLDRPADHFDAIVHVAQQRPPSYARW